MKKTYQYFYKTPDNFTDMIMNSDGNALTGLRFTSSKEAFKHTENCEEKDLKIFRETSRWLDCYFEGRIPNFTPEYKIADVTPFRQDVIDIMNSIKYGETLTYGEISKRIAEKRGIKRMSAQAVGRAVGWNPICIIIPCHRVMGANGKLTGYGGGIENKIALLTHEKNNLPPDEIPRNPSCFCYIDLLK